MSTYSDNIQKIRDELKSADAVMIGAGSGLSTSAGFTYSGERFEKYFSDFKEKYGIKDMYSGGFYPFPKMEEYWAWWSRHIWINRYMKAPNPVYDDLLALVKDKDYFVLTTNVDHQFQMAGFDKKRLFYTQGDYGLFQCADPCRQTTYDNKEIVLAMVKAQGFAIGEEDTLYLPEGVNSRMEVPTSLIPYCDNCGEEMTMNLRCDDSFVEDDGWHAAAGRYHDFTKRHEDGKILYLELGVGMNTPVIIKYPFWQATIQNEKATYVCLNYGEAYAPKEIQDRSICMDADISSVVSELL